MRKGFYKMFTKPGMRKAMMISHDIIVVWIVFLATSYLTFNSIGVPGMSTPVNVAFIAVISILTIFILWLLRFYRRVWTFAGYLELVSIYASCVLSGIAVMVGAVFLKLPHIGRFFIMYTVLLIGGISFFRVFLRVFRITRQLISAKSVLKNKDVKRTMIIGVGNSGNNMMKAILGNGANRKVVCCIDDDPAKKGKYLHGVQIIGGRENIIRAAQKFAVNEILLSMPSATPENTREILDICEKTGCAVKTLPSIDKIIDGKVMISSFRDVEVTDLLTREPVELDSDYIKDYIAAKTVMVTGGGGSIGSELCRQIAKYNPSRLIILDIHENSAYDIQQELLREYPELNLNVVIASICDTEWIEEIFKKYRPSVVYHAAAHKHVPLMEESPNECVKNNVFGTFNVANSAGKNGVEHFILISSDKAVNPPNIMGASKRASEMIIQGMHGKYATNYSAVRFGNVLNSNGSVFPLFKKQIEQGGPVTVTHKDIVRYFMTIPEAVSLVLHAGCSAGDGEVFILDMGPPVRIDDMARKLIKLSGYEPDVDMEVKYIGLRPGEKLFEELATEKERVELRKTDNKLIYIAPATPFDVEKFWRDIKDLKSFLAINGTGIQYEMAKIVDTYDYQEETHIQTEEYPHEQADYNNGQENVLDPKDIQDADVLVLTPQEQAAS